MAGTLRLVACHVTIWSPIIGGMDSQDTVFRALADPTRREILDLLFERDGRTVGELSEAFADRMSRFGVMKHLGVLIEADLVSPSTRAAAAALHLNPVPIEQVANRWISKYAARFTAALVALQEHVDADHPGASMTITAHVYQIYIPADAAAVWAGDHRLGVDPALLPRHRPSPSPRSPARRYRTVIRRRPRRDRRRGRGDDPARGRPAGPVRADLARALRRRAWPQEPPSRVEWTVEQVGDGLTRVRLVHGDLAGSPLTWASVKDGWVWVLDALKTRAGDRPRPAPGRPSSRRRRPRRPTATGTGARGSRRTTRPWSCSTGRPRRRRRRGAAAPGLRRGVPLGARAATPGRRTRPAPTTWSPER